MNFLSINVRGVGVVGKAAWVKGMVEKFGVDFLVVQESLLSGGNNFDFSRLWGRRDFGMDAVDSTGRSGGLANLWNPKNFKKMASVADRNFLLTTGSLVEDGTVINVINVYAPQKVVEKRVLWERLKGLIQGSVGMWILIGDFNAVRFQEERRNSEFNHISALDFNSFIDDVSLQEYSMRGNRFTFLAGKGKGVKMSKIDRVLVCRSFLIGGP